VFRAAELHALKVTEIKMCLGADGGQGKRMEVTDTSNIRVE